MLTGGSPRGACTSKAVRSRQADCVHRAPRRLPPKAAILPAFLAIALTIGSVHAASVTVVQGQVLVNSGQGYRLVEGSTVLDAGATVVANPGAVAHVLYPGGCRVTVEPGSVYQIASQPPCQTGQPTKTGGLNDKGDSGAPSNTSSWGINPWVLGGGAVLLGGGGAYAIIRSLSP